MELKCVLRDSNPGHLHGSGQDIEALHRSDNRKTKDDTKSDKTATANIFITSPSENERNGANSSEESRYVGKSRKSQNSAKGYFRCRDSHPGRLGESRVPNLKTQDLTKYFRGGFEFSTLSAYKGFVAKDLLCVCCASGFSTISTN